jgi:flagellar hook protein FlgE
MGFVRALTSGASSLRANQQRFDIISNNLANTNTTGYKSERANFVEQFNQAYTLGHSPDNQGGTALGGMDPLQFGLGVRLGSVTKDMSQGLLETTNRPLDLALQGEGYFVFNMNGRQLFSRAGAFSQDRDGYFVDTTSGAFVQGYNIAKDANGKTLKDVDGNNVLSGKLENIRVPSTLISEPKQTQNVTVKGNLNSQLAATEFRTTSITIYDNQGGARTLELTFTKTANPNEFTVTGTIDGTAVNIANNTITFNDDGTLNTPLNLSITAADLNTAIGSTVFDATTPKDITVKLSETGNLGGSLTQFNASNSLTFNTQDGLQAGELTDLGVDNEGKIWGSFSNGASEVVGQVAMAKFSNEAGLIKEGGNFLTTSPNSGLPNIGTAGTIFPSTKIIGGALESSNVDMTTEFVDMINTQRAFEAVSRAVTTTDQLLQVITSLKR